MSENAQDTVKLKAEEPRKAGINQLTLRLIAMLATVLAEMSYMTVNLSWMYCFRWIAYPVFAYLIVEGYSKSGDRLLYGKRLLIFAVLSEVPYDLMRYGVIYTRRGQNVIFTLFLGYLALSALEYIRKRFENTFVTLVTATVLMLVGSNIARILSLEMCSYGVFLIIMFNIAEYVTYWRLLQFFSLGYIMLHSMDSFGGPVINGITYEIPVQVLGIAALALIWLYNGARGPNSLKAKRLYYAFYPVHMLILWLIKLMLARA